MNIIKCKMTYSTVNRRPWLICQMYITNGVNQIYLQGLAEFSASNRKLGTRLELITRRGVKVPSWVCKSKGKILSVSFTTAYSFLCKLECPLVSLDLEQLYHSLLIGR